MTRRQMAADLLYGACEVAYIEAKTFMEDHGEASIADYRACGLADARDAISHALDAFENILTSTALALQAAGNPEAIADAQNDPDEGGSGSYLGRGY